MAIAVLLFAGSLADAMQQEAPRPSNPNGWTLPPDAANEKNPFAGDAKAIEAGKTLYKKTCDRCHGPGGKGDGKDADPDAQQDMDLTVARRAARSLFTGRGIWVSGRDMFAVGFGVAAVGYLIGEWLPRLF